MNLSNHAAERTQQRCIPPVVQRWLDEFGEERYDGHGAIKVYFSRRSKKRMEKTLGRHFVRQNQKYLAAYRVESTDSGCEITTGWLTRRIGRK